MKRNKHFEQKVFELKRRQKNTEKLSNNLKSLEKGTHTLLMILGIYDINGNPNIFQA
jgi:hypothetical protein